MVVLLIEKCRLAHAYGFIRIEFGRIKSRVAVDRASYLWSQWFMWEEL